MAETYSVTAELRARVTDFVNGFKQAKSAATDFVDSNKQTFDSFKQVGVAATAGGLAIGAGLGGAVKVAADFEAQMSTVGAISGATGDEMQQLSDKAREMGSTTKYSASESAKALEDLSRMGWTTTEMLDGLDGVMALASAGGIELSDAANITASSLAMFGMEADESSRVADVLAAAASGTGTDVLALGESFKMVGPSANAAGMEIEETAAFLGLLADNSILGSSAGTTMNAMLRDMKKSSEDGAIAIGDTAVAIYDADDNMRGFSDIIADVEGATEGMTTAQRDAALMAIFGDEAMRGLNVALGSGSEELKRIEDEMRGAEGTAKDMSDAMQDNLSGSLSNLKSAVEEIAISFGTVLIPIVESVVGFFQALADKFNGLSSGAKKTIAIVTALAGGIMIVGGVVLTLIGFIPSIVAGFTAISTVVSAVGSAFALLTAPIGLAIAAVVAVVAAIVYAYTQFEWFRDAVGAVWDFIWDTISTIVEGISDLIVSVWGFIADWWTENQELIRSTAETVWNAISEVISVVMDVIVPMITQAMEVVKEVIGIVWDFIEMHIKNVLDVVTGIIKATMQVINGDWDGAWNTIKETFENVWKRITEFLSNAVETIKNMIKRGFEVVKNTIKTVMDAVKSIITSIWNGIKSFISSVMSGISSTISSIWNAILSVITSIVNSIRDTVTNIFDSLKGIVTGAMDSVKSAVSNGMEGALKVVTGIAKSFFDAGRNIVKSIASGITSAVSFVTDAIGNVTAKIRNFLPFSPAKEGALKDIMNVQIAESIAESIDSGKSAAVKSMKSLTDGLGKELGSFDGGINISDQVNSINRQANRQMQSDFSNNINVDKQPAIINVHVGSNKIATEIVDDISRLQGSKHNIRRSSYGR